MVGRCPRWAAPPRAPIVEMWDGSGCFGWCLSKAGAGCPGEAGVQCPGGECPRQGNHLWEGSGVTHPGSHQLCTPRAGQLSPAGTQDGASESRSLGEMSHCCSSSPRSESSVGSLFPKGEHSGYDVSQPQNYFQLSLLGILPQKKIVGLVLTWDSNG